VPSTQPELFAAAARRKEVASQVAALTAAFERGDPADAALVRSCEERLAALRGRWREESALFGPAEIAALKALASKLRRAGRPSPQEVLRGVFGHAAFRPGQEAIVDAVLAGRTASA
jgi:ATP-dependent DNA helicase RecQ